MLGGGGWGQWGSSEHHQRYVQRARNPRRRLCHKCRAVGARRSATHLGMCNGVALTQACEFHAHQWRRGK